MSGKELPCAGEYTEQSKKTPIHQRRTITTVAGIFEGVTIQLLSGLHAELVLEKDGKAQFIGNPSDGGFPGYYVILSEGSRFNGQVHQKGGWIIVRPEQFAEEDKIYFKDGHSKKE